MRNRYILGIIAISLTILSAFIMVSIGMIDLSTEDFIDKKQSNHLLVQPYNILSMASNCGHVNCSIDSDSYKGPELTINSIKNSVNNYISESQNTNLSIEKIILFDNHGYAQIIESDTGIGAMEVLIDPPTKRVYPEHGPNITWNLKYGSSKNLNMFNYDGVSDNLPSSMTISKSHAVEIIKDYLEKYPIAESYNDPTTFYGYYSFILYEKGQVTGVISVNGFSGNTMLHLWHGQYIDES